MLRVESDRLSEIHLERGVKAIFKTQILHEQA